MKRLFLGLSLAGTILPMQLSAAEVDEELWDEEIPMVLSATRLKQAQSEAPASITVIDKSMLENLGVRKLPEIFRLVPGMQVGYVNGNQAAVGYHGLTDDNSRRMQVLIDGRSIYQQALSRILWFDLPLAIENIERIEVIRGPNTASYGANSYLAIINIITRHPSDTNGMEVVFRSGQRGVNDLTASWSNVVENLEYRITVAKIEDDGFDLQRDKVTERFDSSDSNFIQFDGIYNDEAEQYRLQAGFKTGARQIDRFFGEITPYHEIEDDHSFVQFSYTNNISNHRKRKIQFYYDANKISENWQACLPRLLLTDELFDLFSMDSIYTDELVDALFTGAPPPTPSTAEIANQTSLVLGRAFTDGAIETCGYANQDLDETRFDLEWEETLKLNDSTRMVAGANLRIDRTQSESFFAQKISKNTARIFANVEWKSSQDTLFNFGANVENDEDAGTEISPRIALIHHLGETHTIRAIAALATRTPDIFEESANRKYLVRSLTPQLPGGVTQSYFYQHAKSNGGLSAEKIRSFEVGYFGHFPATGILFDIKIFHDELSDIIEGSTQLDQFEISNSGDVTFSGIEAQLDYKISNQLRWWNTYAYLDIDDTIIKIHLKSSISNSGSSALFYTPGNGWNLALAAYSNSTWYGAEFIRGDVSVSYNFNFNNSWKLNSRITWQHRFDDNYLFDASNLFTDADTFYLQFVLSQQ